MKIIHTGDWHIGKIVNEFSLIDDQRYILGKLMDIIQQEMPNALVIAGDLYDRSIPPVEAVELVDDVFSRILLEFKIPILVVAGNHDGAERLSFASKILTTNGLHIAGTFDGNIKKIVLQDDFGPVNFYLLPYTDPRSVRHIYGDNNISTHDDAMRRMVEDITREIDGDNGEKTRNVMVTHGYITHMGQAAECTSDSERPLSIGGTDFVSTDHFGIFNYTALGHLHAPQKAGSDTIRYSGSLIKYSISEVNQRKAVNIVELSADGQATTTIIELVPKRDMRIIKGPIEELISPEVYKDTNVEDYVYAVVTDKGELIDPISKLRTVYPNIMGLSKESTGMRDENKTSASQDYKTKSKLELFEEFYDAMQGEPLDEKEREIVVRIIGEVERTEKKL